MGRLPRERSDDEWTLRFVTDRRSRKAADIRRTGQATLVFQRDAEEAFVALTGAAVMRESATEVRARWKDAFAPYFPSQTDRANAAFIEFRAERMELWIRGVTPEPFGLKTTIVERAAEGGWRVIS